MTVAVFTGTRLVLSPSERDMVDGEIASLPASTRDVFVGDAPGLDAWVRDAVNALATRRRLKVFAADWKTHGKAAGPMRNRQMLTEALRLAGDRHLVHVYAFPSPSSKGTWDCLKTAAALGIAASVHPVGLR